ncbi:MAG: M23 family metallopeptidase, partial [Bacteroidota bacterium]
HYQAVKAYAYAYYCANFAQPFDGEREPSFRFGAVSGAYVHRGVDWAGSFPVQAPASGVVTYSGPDGTAGMWKIQNNRTGEVKEWSVFAGNALYTRDKDKDSGLYAPEALLASGDWVDLKPDWGHTDGTVVIIDHGHHLQTRYRHMDIDTSIARGTRVSKGDRLGMAANHGHSAGAHLHYELIFTYMGRSEYLNPICPR